MEIIKTKSNAWGQQVLEGANLELVTLFVVAGIVLIVAHAVLTAWLRRRRNNAPGND